MTFADKIKKLTDLAGKLGSDKIQLGSQWASTHLENERAEQQEFGKILPLRAAIVGEEIQTAVGKYFLIRRNLKTVWPESVKIVQLYKDVFLKGGMTSVTMKSDDVAVLLQANPQAITYLDIETCGFSGTNIFLIGWCYFDGEDDLVVEQAFARDYAEEAGIIYAICERLMKTHVLATYNGKRFDFPSICERAIIHRQLVPPVLAHVDLLDHARAKWKPSLPNCKLQTLEMQLCGRRRHGDIPGAEIPQAYHDFVKTGDARKIKTIIHHNFLDIVTLAEITARLLAGDDPKTE
jgi:uncharacterized protein YprB with RNaseH-like and TPR domain